MELNRNTEAEHLHVSVGIAKPMLAEVAVYNEDCRQTMERLQSNSLDLIVTSPPYFNEGIILNTIRCRITWRQ